MRHFCATIILLAIVPASSAQWIISGNETKIDLTSGAGKVVPAKEPDSLTILDFSKFPPAVQHLTNVSNSVIGPPSNIAITPDGSLALIADSLKVDPKDATKWVPESYVHLLDLSVTPARIIGRVTTGLQPSGISISSDGQLALVANRAEGSISVLKIRGHEVKQVQIVKVCEPAESVSDVAIHPNGKLALASMQKGGYLAVLKIEGDQVISTGRKISTYGQPYRCVITPDGQLGVTAGQGLGNGLDADAITVIDLTAEPFRTIDYVPVGAVPESFEVSPDGKLLAAVVMNGSNLAENDPNHSRHGAVVLFARKGKTFEKVDEHRIGRIPEGVAFSPDGRYLVVQCHPDRELWTFVVKGKKLKESGQRIPVPGMPSSLRAGGLAKRKDR